MNSITVDGLESETEYYYAVRAANRDLSSKLSNEISVTTKNRENSIGCIQLAADDIRVSYAGNQVTVENKTPEILEVSVYTPLGTCIENRKIGEGTTFIYLREGQMYILKVGSLSYKIVL